jgi:CYTH domain-containing protein
MTINGQQVRIWKEEVDPTICLVKLKKQVEVKLPLFLTKHRTMKMYWGVLWEVGTERNN